MTSGRLFLLMVGWTSLLPVAAYARLEISSFQQQTAAESAAKQLRNQPRDASQAKTPDDKRRRKDEILPAQKKMHGHAAVKNRPPSLAARMKERSKQLPNARKQVPSEAASNSQQPSSDQSGGSAKTQIVQRKTAKTPARRQTPAANRAGVPLLSNARHRGANLAAIGGPAYASSTGTGAISGTTVHRRP